MLAALLVNLPDEPFVPGGIYGVRDEDERAERALQNLREEYFERERQKQEIEAKAVNENMPAKTVYVVPKSDYPVGKTASPTNKTDDEIIALLLIIAEL